MKIIDFDRKGNVIRFYLGKDDCEDYWGDDWGDAPYDCNAGIVYPEYIEGHVDIFAPFDCEVFEPCDGVINCGFSKEDFKKRIVPCIIIVPPELLEDCFISDQFNRFAAADGVKRYYFGDKWNFEYVKENHND